MGYTVYFNDGSNEFITDDGICLERIIYDRLGSDAARLFRDYVYSAEKDIELYKQAQEEAEKIADGYHSLCNNALENFSQLKALIHNPRIKRTELEKIINLGYDDLYFNM